MHYYSANADLPAEGDCSLFIVNCSFAKGDCLDLLFWVKPKVRRKNTIAFVNISQMLLVDILLCDSC